MMAAAVAAPVYVEHRGKGLHVLPVADSDDVMREQFDFLMGHHTPETGTAMDVSLYVKLRDVLLALFQ